MKKRKPWTRFFAVVLALTMLITNQNYVSASDVTQETAETMTEGMVNSENEEPQQDTEPVVPDQESSEGAISESDNASSESGNEPIPEKKAQDDKREYSSEGVTESPNIPENLNENEQKDVQKKVLDDKDSGVNLTYMSDQLPENVQLHVTEKKQGEDKDYPTVGRDKIENLMDKEGLILRDLAVYDISLGGSQPTGNVQVKLPVPEKWDGELDAWYIDENGNVTHMDRETEDSEGYYTFQTDHFSLYAVSVSDKNR